MKCYNCKAEIEDDSWFCDQCGVKLYICPDCRIPGKGEGKRCGKCGKPLVEAKTLAQKPTETPVVPPEQPVVPPQGGQTGGSQPVTPPGGGQPPVRPATNEAPTMLICDAQNVTLQLVDGALIGRVYGLYSSQLAGLQFISASHATLKKEGDHWIIADVGSRNGTAVNGKWCFSPLPFRKGDVVRIGNFYDFRAV